MVKSHVKLKGDGISDLGNDQSDKDGVEFGKILYTLISYKLKKGEK